MMGTPNIVSGRGTRLRAQDEQTLVPPNPSFFQYSNIPLFLAEGRPSACRSHHGREGCLTVIQCFADNGSEKICAA